jgi:hypothetical protein
MVALVSRDTRIKEGRPIGRIFADVEWQIARVVDVVIRRVLVFWTTEVCINKVISEVQPATVSHFRRL